MTEAPPLDTEIAIETPEHIVFRLRLAGPARRLLAYLVDVVVCYGTLSVVGLLVMLMLFGTVSFASEITSAAKTAGGLFMVLLFVAQWGYFACFEAWTGRTPGKIAAALTVVTTAGRPIDARAAMLRNLLRAADFLPVAYLVGVASMALSSRFQRLGDLVAGTMVVYADRARGARAFELVPPASDAELGGIPADVRLDVEERRAIELFLRRRARLGSAREHELAELLARPLGARLGASHADPSRLLALLYDRAVTQRTRSPHARVRGRAKVLP